MFTERDKEFLLKRKAEGMSQEDSLKALTAVKSQFEQKNKTILEQTKDITSNVEKFKQVEAQSPLMANIFKGLVQAEADKKAPLESRSPTVAGVTEGIMKSGDREQKEVMEKKVLTGEAPIRPGTAMEETIENTVGKVPYIGGALDSILTTLGKPLSWTLDKTAATGESLIEAGKAGIEELGSARDKLEQAVFGKNWETDPEILAQPLTPEEENAVNEMTKIGGISREEAIGRIKAQDMTASERIIRGGGALADALQGGMGVVFAPVTAVIDELAPEMVGEGMEYAFGKINDASNAVGSKFMETLNIDPESEQGQTISKLFNVTGQLLAFKAMEGAGEVYGKAKETAGFRAGETTGVTTGSSVPLKEGLAEKAFTTGESLVTKGKGIAEDLVGKVEQYAERKSMIKDVKTQAMDVLNPKIAELDKIGETYRDVLRPTQGEVKAIETKGGKSMDDLYKLAAEEELLIKMTKDKKLDTLEAIEQLQDRKGQVFEELNNALEAKPEKVFDLNKMKEDIKTKLRNEFKNDTEYKGALKEAETYIEDAIAERGEMLNGVELNNLKQGMWEVGYDQLKPTSKTTAQAIGNVAKDWIEKQYSDVNIKGLNELGGQYITLETLLKNANGRVIKGGRLGGYVAKMGGATIGSAVPVVGSLAGWLVGEKVYDFLANPERITKKAIKEVQNIKGSMPKPAEGFKMGETPITREALTADIYKSIKENGGVTISLKGEKPIEGYSYSPYKELEVKVPAKEFKTTHVDEFIDSNYNTLAESGNHFGAWEENGQIFLDVSKVGEASPKTIKLAEENGQLGVYDLKSGETINTSLYEKANIPDLNRGEVKGANQSGSSGSTTQVSGSSTGQAKIVDPKAFERAEGLSPENAKIQEKAFEKILKNEDQILADYKSKYGNEVNTDNFRQYFTEEGYNGSNAASVQEPASYLGKRMYTEGLKNEQPYVVATGGGSGVGKSSALNNLPEFAKAKKNSAVLLDSNLSSWGSLVKKVKEAKEAGKEFVEYYTYRDPIDSFENGVVKRMLENAEEGGRLVPSKITAKNHIDSWEVAKKFQDSGGTVRFIDNSLGKGNAKAISRAEMEAKIKYPSVEELTNQFNNIAKDLYDKGKITKEQYTGYIE